MPSIWTRTFLQSSRRAALALILFAACLTPVTAQETLPWKSNAQENSSATQQTRPYDRSGRPSLLAQGRRLAQDDGNSNNGYGAGSTYNSGPVVRNTPPSPSGSPPQGGTGNNYEYYEKLPPEGGGNDDQQYREPRKGYDYQDRKRRSRETYVEGPDRGFEEPGTYNQDEIKQAGHRFFGSISQGLASIIEYAFQKSGRPNGYILGEDAGGAFVAGLRYGEGRLYTRDAGTHRVYWQGPSVGYDFGGEGSKTMILVYNLRDPSDIYHRFGGVQGSAYLIGGVSVQFQKYGDVVLAPIRSGVGLRLGANIGYLKYTRSPTWNPF